VPTEKLDRRIIGVWRLSALVNLVLWPLLLIVPLALISFSLTGSHEYGDQQAAWALGLMTLGLVVGTVVAMIICVFVVPALRWRRFSYQVGEEEIDIATGIIWHKRIIIPLIRIQNVDTLQGPLLRMRGLKRLTVATAAGEHAIPGLAAEAADALRDKVAVLARIVQEDV
jgi:membrane protein YdbS with pleckstrin-like domain